MHVRSAPPRPSAVPPSRATRSPPATSPPWRPRLRPLQQSGADPAEAGVSAGEQEHSASHRPIPPGQSPRGPLPWAGVRTSFKGEGGLWGACAQAGRPGYPGTWARLRKRGRPAPQVRLPPRGLGRRRPVYTARARLRNSAAERPRGCRRRKRGARGRQPHPCRQRPGSPAPAAAAGGGPAGRGRGPARGGASAASTGRCGRGLGPEPQPEPVRQGLDKLKST